jgi:hypothetical protein
MTASDVVFIAAVIVGVATPISFWLLPGLMKQKNSGAGATADTTKTELIISTPEATAHRDAFVRGELVTALRNSQNEACNRAHNAAIERAAQLCESRGQENTRLAEGIRTLKVRPKISATTGQTQTVASLAGEAA